MEYPDPPEYPVLAGVLSSSLRNVRQPEDLFARKYVDQHDSPGEVSLPL